MVFLLFQKSQSNPKSYLHEPSQHVNFFSNNILIPKHDHRLISEKYMAPYSKTKIECDLHIIAKTNCFFRSFHVVSFLKFVVDDLHLYLKFHSSTDVFQTC